MRIRLMSFALLAIALGMSSCSKKAGTDVVDDGDDQNNPPTTVTDLAVTQVTPVSVTLRWTAPQGGGPTILTASSDLRYAASAIDGTNWASATAVAEQPGSLPPGMTETMVVTGMPPDTTLYFALRTCSQKGLWSEVSNSPAATLPPEAGIAFADTALEAVIRVIVQKPSGELLASDLAGIEEIDASNRQIHNLGGLQYCVTLARLGIHGNAIASLEPLAGLTRLTDLDASANQISDLQPLAGLTTLVNLSLGENQISDVGPLHALQGLNILYLNGNRIADIAPLAGCIRVNHLFLGDNLISDLSPLTGLIYLHNLNLASNSIQDLGALVANTGLGIGTTIWLAGNPLTDAARNEQIPALRARGIVVNDR
jgi:Leucine-rich repeat (LRR) protein